MVKIVKKVVLKKVVKKVVMKVVVKLVVFKLIKEVLSKFGLVVYIVEVFGVVVKDVCVVLVLLEGVVVVLVYKKGVGSFILLGLLKIIIVNVLVKLKCKGINLFIKEEQWFVVKLVFIKLKVCLFKKFKDVVL